MIKKEKYIIRNMSEDEVSNIAIEWAAKEGWNPGLYDSYCFFSSFPKSFYVGLLEDKPISCISAVSYDEYFAFLGFYIVKSEYRGKGYGLKIWNEAIDSIKSKNIGLDGVIEQQDNYKKSGFKFAYSNIRYEGIAKPTTNNFSEITLLSEININELEKYDAEFFPAHRKQFLQYWINQPKSLALAAIKNNKLSGYSVIRKCRNGYKIGPLYANTNEIANKLFLTSCSFAEPESHIYLDIPELNIAATKLAESYDMKKVFATARMYTKSQPKINLNKIFGVTSFELG